MRNLVKTYRLKNIYIFLYIIKWLKLQKKTWEKNGVEVIRFNGKKWLNEKHIETQLKHSNLVVVTNKYSSDLKKQRQELEDCGNYQPCRKFSEENFAIQIIMDCRTTSAVNFKTRLVFNQYDPMMTQ